MTETLDHLITALDEDYLTEEEYLRSRTEGKQAKCRMSRLDPKSIQIQSSVTKDDSIIFDLKGILPEDVTSTRL